MSAKMFALLVHNEAESLEPLKQILHELHVETCSVGSVKEAGPLMQQTQPHLVFTEPVLADGSFTRIMDIAENGGVPLNVIVVGSLKDVKHYISAMARGAFDFIVPPFERQSLDYIVWAAGEDVRHRRRVMIRATAA
jgi:cyclic di-GMP phosphodiesterase